MIYLILLAQSRASVRGIRRFEVRFLMRDSSFFFASRIFLYLLININYNNNNIFLYGAQNFSSFLFYLQELRFIKQTWSKEMYKSICWKYDRNDDVCNPYDYSRSSLSSLFPVLKAPLKVDSYYRVNIFFIALSFVAFWHSQPCTSVMYPFGILNELFLSQKKSKLPLPG